ncbi:MAG: hypothetical protein ACR2NN_27365 [Bryobacteraceae bacterium]
MITKAGSITVGYLETKDIGKSLDEAERSDQLKRYLRSLPNLILTDYLEFRWYVNGERRKIVLLAQARAASSQWHRLRMRRLRR